MLRRRGGLLSSIQLTLRESTTDLVILQTLAHEATHVVQMLRYGSQVAEDSRYRADVARYGNVEQYHVTRALSIIPIDRLNPIDSRFALEAIANHVKDITFASTGR